MGFERSIRPLGLDLLEDPDTYYLEPPDDFIGLLGWNGAATGAGATQGSSLYGVDATENVLGAYKINTGTTNTGRSAIYKNDILLGRHSVMEKWRVALETLGTVVENYTTWVGLHDECNTSVSPVNAVLFRYNYNVNGGNWQCVCRDNGGAEEVINTTVPGAITYQILTIRINEDATAVEFFIDGQSMGSIITAIPKTGTRYVYPCMKILKSAGITDRNFHVDWHFMKITRVQAR